MQIDFCAILWRGPLQSAKSPLLLHCAFRFFIEHLPEVARNKCIVPLLPPWRIDFGQGFVWTCVPASFGFLHASTSYTYKI